MKKRFLIIVLVIVVVASFVGCNTGARYFGGEMTVELEPNEKLANITWKDESLWILTKPMTESDVAETYTFKEDSNFGVWEGTVTIVETKE